MKATVVLTLVLLGCTDPVLPTSKDYPCTTRGKVCGNSMCCLDTEDCGGEVPSCPAGYCCYVASDPLGPLVVTSASAKKPILMPQFAPSKRDCSK